MGQLVEGTWQDSSTQEIGKDGRFVRRDSAFRSWITPDGSPGPTGEGGFAAEPGRYHLYVSLACPWAHRTLIYRSILGLQDAISVSVVHPVNVNEGWEFAEYPGATPDHVNGARYLHQVYTAADGQYSGKVTVPVLWDRKRGTIVNNESAEIIRMLADAFRPWARTWRDLRPADKTAEIDEVNDLVYRAINNGVYRTGFARSQEAYEEGIERMFAAFGELDARLSRGRFLHGGRPLESDIRLFATMIRFEPVYYFHFKCNRRRLDEYPALKRHTRDVLNTPGVRPTVNLDHIIDHYYLVHRRINPYGIIPAGAHVDLDGPDWRPAAAEGAAAC